MTLRFARTCGRKGTALDLLAWCEVNDDGNGFEVLGFTDALGIPVPEVDVANLTFGPVLFQFAYGDIPEWVELDSYPKVFGSAE